VRTDLPAGVTEHRDRFGRLRFRARALINGERKSLGLYDTPEEAGKVYAATLDQLAGEERGVTLVAWGEKWLQRRGSDGLHRAQHKAVSTWKTHVACAHFACWPMRRIGRTDVVRWIRELLRKPATRAKTSGPPGRRVVELKELDRTLSRQTAINALALLRRALNDAADEGLIPGNVALGVGVPRVPRSDEGWTYLSAAEIADVFGVELTDEQRAIFTVAIFVGMRAGELWGLRWADVILDGARPEIVVRYSYRGPTKSGKVRRVPLLRQAREGLEAWRRAKPAIGSALVFPADGGGCHAEGFEAGWARVRRLACIDRRVRFHDFRHTCASHLIMGTWGRAWRLEEVQAMLGHGSRTTTERYAHLAPEGLHGARDATDAGHRMDTPERGLNKNS
jgi:integrase